MPVSTLPITAVTGANILTSVMWNAIVKDNLNKLLNQGHRVLTVAQFGALTGLEGTKGVVAPDEVYLEVDATNGVQWHLAYESGEPTYKWRFLGGPPLYFEVAASESTASAPFVALATSGPSIPLPRAGDYDVVIGSYLQPSATSSASMSYDIGGTGAVTADQIETQGAGGGAANVGNYSRKRRKAALTAVTLTAKYGSSAGQTNTFKNRWMEVVPVRLI